MWELPGNVITFSSGHCVIWLHSNWAAYFNTSVLVAAS